jgi:hypothetical protein
MADDTLDPTDDLVALFSHRTEPVIYRAPAPPQWEGVRKRCSRCREHKPLTAFPRDKKHLDGRHSWCLVCRRAYKKDAHQKAGPALKRRLAFKHRERKYGLVKAQFDAMLAAQNGQCAICQTPFKSERLANVDHCHTTGKVRALLCHRCNFAVGLIENEDPTRTAAIHAYIQSYKT